MELLHILKKVITSTIDTGNLTASSILLTLAMSIASGLFIYWIYYLSTRTDLYNRSFNKSLAALPLVTAAIMLAMQNNLVMSLGMVGALSIVRFRNAVKDSSDLTFLFWSISTGIILGAGLLGLSILLSLAMTVLFFGLDLLPSARPSYLLVVAGAPDTDEEDLLNTIRPLGSGCRIRSRSQTADATEWVIQLRSRQPAALVQAVSGRTGVTSVNLMTHSGDVRF